MREDLPYPYGRSRGIRPSPQTLMEYDSPVGRSDIYGALGDIGTLMDTGLYSLAVVVDIVVIRTVISIDLSVIERYYINE